MFQNFNNKNKKEDSPIDKNLKMMSISAADLIGLFIYTSIKSDHAIQGSGYYAGVVFLFILLILTFALQKYKDKIRAKIPKNKFQTQMETADSSNIKEKDNVILPAEAGGDEINQVFEVFYKSVKPNINYGNKTSRKAAEWLVKKYGLKKTLEITRYSCQVQGQRFAPTITTPYQLKEKMSELAIFGQRQKANAPGVLKI